MATDASYPSVVQIRQDGNLYVPTGKSINIESGGQVVYSGGGLNLLAVESISSSATPFSNAGVTVFGTTATGASYNLAQPSQVGLSKFLIKTVHGATTTTETVLCTGATILNATTAATSVITFANRGYVHMISVTTNQWAIVSTVGTKAEVSYS